MTATTATSSHQFVHQLILLLFTCMWHVPSFIFTQNNTQEKNQTKIKKKKVGMEAALEEVKGSPKPDTLKRSKGGMPPDEIKRNKNRGKGTPEELEGLLKSIAAQAGISSTTQRYLFLSFLLFFLSEASFLFFKSERVRAKKAEEGEGEKWRKKAVMAEIFKLLGE